MARLPASRRKRWWFAAVAAGVFLAPGVARGGGGPENVLVVVNPKSPTSRAVANAYVHLRKIPPINVVCVSCDPDQSFIPVEAFRTSILRPILETVNERDLAGQIDCVAYSSDFPWGVELETDVQHYLDALPADKKTSLKGLNKRGSLTSMTYLWQRVIAGNIEYMTISSNRYARRMAGQEQKDPTISFSGRMQFGAEHEVVDSGGQSYLLSVMLGVAVGKDRRGNTPVEIFSCLARSAAADGTRPRGTVYFAETKDIRTRTRAPVYPAAVRALRELGVGAEIIPLQLPRGRSDVLGLTIGTAGFDWPASGSRILPGAICDNLTSTGGYFGTKGNQTPLTVFIRAGAAGACGTVIEPYAIAAKFPSPMIHVHYARGCSLAEAFYQSVEGPFQLILVGDALCQPWARPPKVTLAEPQAGASVRGAIQLKPTIVLPEGEKLDHMEVLVDGLVVAVEKTKDTFSLDTTGWPDGDHEIRLVAVGPAPIHSRGRAILPLRFANHGRTIEASVNPPSVAAQGTFTVVARCPGASRIEVSHNHEVLGTIGGASGSLEVKAAAVGAGPVRLEVVGLFDEPHPRDRVLAPPLSVTVKWAE